MPNRRWLQIAALYLPIVPVLVFVAPFDIRLPVLDQWGLIALFEQFARGELGLPDLYAWQNHTHRMVFPRLAFVLLAFASDWSIELELSIGIALVVAKLGLLLHVSETPRQQRTGAFLGAGLLTSAVAFSLVQWFNWQWGFAVAVFAVDTLVCGALWLVIRIGPARPWTALFAAALCCAVASFSMLAGLLGWLALLPAVALLGQRFIRVWLAVAALCWVGYFLFGLPAIEGPPLPTRLAQAPLEHLFYFFALLGAPASYGYQAQAGLPMGALAPAGILVTTAFAGALRLAWRARESVGTECVAAWASLGLFSLLYAGANMVGRAKASAVGAPINPFMQTYLSMYATPASLLTIATIQLTARVVWSARNEPGGEMRAPQDPFGPRVPAKRWARGLAAVATLALLGNLAAAADYAFAKRPWLLGQYAREGFCLEIRRFLASPNTCPFDGNLLAPRVVALEELGFRIPVSSIRFDEEDGEAWGTLSAIRRDGDAYRFSVHLSERALALPRAAVLLADANSRRFFAFDLLGLPRAVPPPDASRLELRAARRVVPRRTNRLTAWIYDREGQRAIRLAGEPPFEALRPARARIRHRREPGSDTAARPEEPVQ